MEQHYIVCWLSIYFRNIFFFSSSRCPRRSCSLFLLCRPSRSGHGASRIHNNWYQSIHIVFPHLSLSSDHVDKGWCGLRKQWQAPSISLLSFFSHAAFSIFFSRLLLMAGWARRWSQVACGTWRWCLPSLTFFPSLSFSLPLSFYLSLFPSLWWPVARGGNTGDWLTVGARSTNAQCTEGRR